MVLSFLLRHTEGVPVFQLEWLPTVVYLAMSRQMNLQSRVHTKNSLKIASVTMKRKPSSNQLPDPEQRRMTITISEEKNRSLS